MKSNYKPIGKYIQRVEHRNRDLKVTRLGLEYDQKFRETTLQT
jgi:type I restriction enzyme S subunit